MNNENAQKKAYGLTAAVIVILVILGLAQIVAGIIAGTLVVLALMMTVEKMIPWFWQIATNPLGKVFVLGGTAWLTHAIFGAGTIIGMIALSWSVLFKVVLIEAKSRELGKA